MPTQRKRIAFLNMLAIASALLLSGCELVGDIFKAGVWVGVLAITVLVVMIGGAIALLRS